MTRQTTIPAVLAEAARKFSQKTWLVRQTDTGWGFLSFQEVCETARYFAAWLFRQGVTKGDRIALVSEAGPEWITAQLGIFFLGAVAVPCSTRLLPAELRLRLDHCEPRLILVSRSMGEKTAALADALASPVSLVCLNGENSLPGAAAFPECCESGKKNFPGGDLSRIEAELREDDEALILYTPGTEGPVKAVRITHANYLALSADAAGIFNVPRMLRTMVAVPADYSSLHIAGISMTLLRGVPLLFFDEPETLPRHRPLPLGLHYPNPVFFLSEPWVIEKFKKKIIRAVERRGRLMRALFTLGIRAGKAYHGDGYNKTPFFVRLKSWFPYYLANRFVFALVRRAFGCRLRFFAGGAGSVSACDQAFFYALGIPVFQGYALMEAPAAVSSNTMPVHKFGASGWVLPGVSCRILNSGGYPAGIGEEGEICVQGRVVMKGYFKNEEATQEAVRNGWLYTGDMGYVDEDGFLVVTGRKSSLLVSQSGGKFSPEIIEEAIASSSPLFRQVLVYNNRRKYSCALVVLDEAQLATLTGKNSMRDRKEIFEVVAESFYAFTRDPFWQKKIPESWRPRTFRVLEEAFCDQNGTLNSAKQMVRERIIRSCQQILESMYMAGDESPFNEANLEAVWRLAQKTLGVKV
ncbi:MAG: AMP-binding protein [Spirochaetales bacterium]|jgi:long-chain acyl-CoA synthetase|nr:AMP-binding protein [Spirochaetales bacterium]